jgi:hypothetical protein
MKHTLSVVLGLIGGALLSLSLSSCGSSGGGGGTTSSQATPTQTIISGTVEAPNGQIAFFRRTGLGNWFVSEAYAAVTGLALVSDGTTVELGRISSSAPFSFSLITSTATTNGRYSFNFTNLGLSPAVDLVVRVKNGVTEMRAFVTGSTVDLNPMTEVAVQRSTQQLGSAPLNHFTIQELADITGAITLLANLQNLTVTAQNLAQTLATISGAVQSSSSITNFVASAAALGQAAQGPGDLGNYFPFTQGNFWKYQGTIVNNGGSSTAFQNSTTVTGTRLVHGISTFVLLDTNPDNQGSAEENYVSKNSTEVTFHGNNDTTDPITPQLVPVQTVRFPLSLGVSTVIADRKGLPYWQDLDGDGINDTFDFKSEYMVKAFEAITVPAGTFQNCARVENTQTVTAHSSAFGITATVTTTETAWVAPGVGYLKRIAMTQSQGFAQDVTESVTEELQTFVADGQGGGLRIQVSPSDATVSINESLQLQATAFDQNNLPFQNLSFAWTSSNPEIASVDQNGLVKGNSVGSASITASLGNLVSNTVPATVKDIQVLSLISTNFGSVNDLVYDKTRQRIYASVSSTSGVRANTITVINPFNGTIGSSIPVGIEPTLLAMSDDDRYLYVSLDHELAVRRIDLTTMTPDLKFAVGGIVGSTPADYSETFKASDIKVLPGSPQSVAIARYGQRFPAQRGVAIYDNGVQRPVTTPFSIATDQPLDQVGPNLLAFSSTANTLYGLNWESNQGLFTMAVSSSGVSVTNSRLQQRQCGGSMSFGQNKLYVSSEVVDPVTLLVLGIFPLPIPCGEAVTDFPQGRVYFLTRNSSFTPIVLSFNNSTFQLESSADLSFLGLQSVGNLIRWGPDGLAFTAFPGKIYIFRTSLLQ